MKLTAVPLFKNLSVKLSDTSMGFGLNLANPEPVVHPRQLKESNKLPNKLTYYLFLKSLDHMSLCLDINIY